MTDRVNALVVVLDKGTRDDDIQPLIDAILQLRNVCSVSGNVVEMCDHIAYARARADLHAQLFDVVRNATR